MNSMKRALITGSSRGIGKAIAIKLAKAGFEVIIHYATTSGKANEVVQSIINEGGKAFAVGGDLCNPVSAEKIMQQIGYVDVLILNASVQIRKAWSEISLEEYEQQMNCNFFSSLKLIQLACPHMIQNHWGRIITIGSVQEKKPHPDMLIYSASKAAQTNMMQSLSLQLAKNGITVNNIAPGVIFTDRNLQALSDEAYAQTVRNSIPLGDYGMPEDCAGMAALLCSDEGRYITGQSIYIDGGKSVQ